MSGDARGDDKIAFYAASLGPTYALSASPVAAQTPDVGGALPAGRYVLHISDPDPATTKIWVRTVKFEKGRSPGVVAAPPNFPLQLSGILAIEIHVRANDSDRVEAVTGGGTANLYITRVSRDL